MMLNCSATMNHILKQTRSGNFAHKASRPTCVLPRATLAYSDDSISPEKRKTMNLLLVGAISLPAASMLGPYAVFFAPKKSGGAGGAELAKDAQGATVRASDWLKTHKDNDRSLVQGLQGEATYLIVTGDGSLESYGLNSICTHLGCVVPWNAAENKFMCPCHGSQYDAAGKKVRGPAPLSLALVHAAIDDDDAVSLSPWTETDFRDGEAPWWK